MIELMQKLHRFDTPADTRGDTASSPHAHHPKLLEKLRYGISHDGWSTTPAIRVPIRLAIRQSRSVRVTPGTKSGTISGTLKTAGSRSFHTTAGQSSGRPAGQLWRRRGHRLKPLAPRRKGNSRFDLVIASATPNWFHFGTSCPALPPASLAALAPRPEAGIPASLQPLGRVASASASALVPASPSIRKHQEAA